MDWTRSIRCLWPKVLYLVEPQRPYLKFSEPQQEQVAAERLLEQQQMLGIGRSRFPLKPFASSFEKGSPVSRTASFHI